MSETMVVEGSFKSLELPLVRLTVLFNFNYLLSYLVSSGEKYLPKLGLL